MKSMSAGLALCLVGGVALAQSPPASAPTQPPSAPAQPATPAASSPTTPPVAATGPGPDASPPTQPSVGAGTTPDARMAPMTGAPEGEIIETPNGFYIVRSAKPPAPDDNNGPAADAADGEGASMQGAGPGDEAGPDAGRAGPMPGGPGAGGAPMMREPRRPRPARVGKGMAMRVRTPGVTVGVKCADDEPMKACVDAVSELLDKVLPATQR